MLNSINKKEAVIIVLHEIYGINRHLKLICPVLLIFAQEETTFNVLELTRFLGQKKFVNVHVLNGKHGFSDPFSNNYNEQLQQTAQDLVDGFLGVLYNNRDIFLKKGGVY